MKLDFLQAHFAWSDKAFGPGRRTKGITNHIRKELNEIEAAPDDLEEWVDVLLLAMDGARRTGSTEDEIGAALATKFNKNLSRVYPFPLNEDTESEHVRPAVNILLKADEYIHGERVSMYGTPAESFVEAATVASLLTGKDITPNDICLVVAATKFIRAKHSPENLDHYIDICGYLGIASDIAQKEKADESILQREPKRSGQRELQSECGEACSCGGSMAEDGVADRDREFFFASKHGRPV